LHIIGKGRRTIDGVTSFAAHKAELWVRQRVLGPLVRRAAPWLSNVAWLWRRLLFRTTFIGITGSVGKTTAKEALAGILAARGRTYKTLGNQNSGVLVPLNLLRVRPWHRYAVIEVGIAEPGGMDSRGRLVRPDVAVMVNLARVHTRGFPDHEQYISEKLRFLNHVAPKGLVIVNGDVPRLSAAADGSRSDVLKFGSDPGFRLRADEVSSRWPDRLSFRAQWDGKSCEVRTQLVGVHWVPSLLAALAAALHLGIGLEEGAAALGRVEPYTARLEPVTLPNGAVVLRDDGGASVDAFNAALTVMEEAQAQRRILVTTGFSDSGMNERALWRHVGARCSGWLDLLVLVGRHHAYAVRKAVEAGMPAGAVYGFEEQDEAAEFLRQELRAGDLALLSGRGSDHAARLFFALIGSVSCWRNNCRKMMLCDGCWELGFQPDDSFVPPSVGRRV
jgi:UDP-N-acetylmuramoyl-tripeptide--D-alanyl-D-alanine ligase